MGYRIANLVFKLANPKPDEASTIPLVTFTIGPDTPVTAVTVTEAAKSSSGGSLSLIGLFLLMLISIRRYLTIAK